MEKVKEVLDELRMVLSQRGGFLDALIPPLLFLIVNAIFGFEIAMYAALGMAFLIGVLRLINKQPILYAFGGVIGVIIAIGISRVLGREEGFFLPGILTSGFVVILCLVSVLIKRPLVAWTSFLVRRWPLDWYWHPKVLPAYQEVTLAWGLFFGARMALQFNLFQEQAANALAWINVLTGWPATVVLLILSYLYGTWRLRNLEGPSVEEYKSGAEPPWESQRKGF